MIFVAHHSISTISDGLRDNFRPHFHEVDVTPVGAAMTPFSSNLDLWKFSCWRIGASCVSVTNEFSSIIHYYNKVLVKPYRNPHISIIVYVYILSLFFCGKTEKEVTPEDAKHVSEGASRTWVVQIPRSCGKGASNLFFNIGTKQTYQEMKSCSRHLARHRYPQIYNNGWQQIKRSESQVGWLSISRAGKYTLETHQPRYKAHQGENLDASELLSHVVDLQVQMTMRVTLRLHQTFKKKHKNGTSCTPPTLKKGTI